MNRGLPYLVVAIVVLISPRAFAQDNSLVGEWELVLQQGRGQSMGYLRIEQTADGLAAYLQGGPALMKLNGNEITLEVDWRDGFDLTQIAVLTGSVEQDTMSGDYGPGDSGSFFGGDPVPPGTWSATRLPDPSSDEVLPPMPVDISGIWTNAPGRGQIRKAILPRTPAGQALTDSYQEVDDPALRCASYGVFRATGFGYPHEIVQTDDQILILVASDYVRRIYLDGRELPADQAPTDLGYSVGHWEGSTLVVETSGLTPNFMSHGNPYSANARFVERFFLDDEGLLHREAEVHDPQNYARPLLSQYIRSRQPATTIVTRVGCDPYGFFRSLAVQERLDEWWSRSAFRR